MYNHMLSQWVFVCKFSIAAVASKVELANLTVMFAYMMLIMNLKSSIPAEFFIASWEFTNVRFIIKMSLNMDS